MMIKSKKFNDLLHSDAGGGILLGMAAIAAIIIANTPLAWLYNELINTQVRLQIGALDIAKPLLLWVNDGLMAVFFFLIGLELKRECIDGELSEIKKVILPAIGAVGGMAVPAAVYLMFNYDDPIAVNGWAIPAATDIAFALGVLALVGSRVPTSIKIFLTSLAVFDDVGAIVIIALFYTQKINMTALLIAAACILILWVMNRKNIMDKSPYLIIGTVMWVALLKSGVHATLGGVLLALFIPMTRENRSPSNCMLSSFEEDLHHSVTYIILPIFAFCNSGLALLNMSSDAVFHSVPIGIACGLFFGKQIGVFGFSYLAIKLGFTEMPKGMTVRHLYGVSLLTGIGFTMSLFIGALAFNVDAADKVFDERLGILVGSFFSGVAGYLVLKSSPPKTA